MKKRSKAFLIFLMSMIWLPVLPVSAQVTDLVENLELSEQQAQKVEEIFNMVENQAQLDRQSYKGNALALIEAAKRRREMVDSHIEALLDQEQKEKYLQIKKERKKKEELFILKEGLLLTEDQAVRVEEILDEYRKQAEADREAFRNQMGAGGGSMRGGPGGMKGGGMRGGMGRGGGMRGSMGMHGGNRNSPILQALKKRLEEKAKEIEKILTEDQQKMYVQIREMQEKELENKLKERMEKMRGRGFYDNEQE